MGKIDGCLQNSFTITLIPIVYRLDSKTIATFQLRTFNSFLAGLGRNQIVYGATQVAHNSVRINYKPVPQNKQEALRANCSNIYFLLIPQECEHCQVVG